MIPLALVTKAFVIVLSLAVFMESLVIGVSILRNSHHNTQLTHLPNSVLNIMGRSDYEKSCALR